jgi:hypothetical protein
VHARDPDDPGARAPQGGAKAVAEPEVQDRRLVASGGKGRREVLEPERLDAEKRAEPESLVARVGAQQKNVHRASFIAGRPRL